MKMKFSLRMIPFCVLAFIPLLGSCTKNESDNTKITNVATMPTIAVPPPHRATMQEWSDALHSTYEESQQKDRGNGITEFMANFHHQNDKKKSIIAFGERDEFRKLTHYTEAGVQISNAICPNVKTYIAVKDGARPVLLIAPCFFGKNGWIFMNKVAIMVDGEVILERDFSGEQINRDSKSYGVLETYDFIASEDDISRLRKITPTSKIMVRLTGTKGYVNLKKEGGLDYIEDFKNGITKSLFVYDALNKALAEHLPPVSH